MLGAEYSMAKAEPEGRTTRFSIQVPFGNWWMTSTGRFGEVLFEGEVAIGVANMRVGRMAMSHELEVEKNIVACSGESR